MFNGTFSTNRIYRAIGVWNISRRAREPNKHTNKQWNNTINRRKSKTFFGRGFIEMIPSPRLGFLRGVILANHLASTDKLTRTTKTQNIYQHKLTWALLRWWFTTKRRYIKCMHLYLYLLYHIQPGNGVSLFLQPWSPHRVCQCETTHPNLSLSDWVGFNVPINTFQVILETSLSSQSLALVLTT